LSACGLWVITDNTTVAASGWAFILVSPSTVTRVEGAVLDEHEAAITSSSIDPIAKKILFQVANLDVITFILVFSFWGS